FSFSFGPFPRQESHFYFPLVLSHIGKPTFHFHLALSRIRTAIFIFRSPFPASGHPLYFFVEAFPHRASDFQSQNYEK
ncbi:MAG: hypothetical protein IJM84_05225, partial [Bacteroidaceae bacterium]|nr:hypothetical protein [Bacteroidaceae bacterium]